MSKVRAKDSHQIAFKLNLHRKEIDVTFALAARDVRKRGREGEDKDLRVLDFRFALALDQLTTVYETVSSEEATWVLSTETPPRYFWKGDEGRSFPAASGDPYAATSWSQRDTWFRRTDICYDRTSLRNSPLTLKKSNPIIDLGKPLARYSIMTIGLTLNRSMDYVPNQLL